MTEPFRTPARERSLVWILDDSPMEAAMARRALGTSYDVELFSDGSSLLERIAYEAPPAALVLDLQLPGMSGIELCRFLRSRYDETLLPILMLTVYGHKSDLVEGLAAGANDYVAKPYDAAELLARVSTLVRIQSVLASVREGERMRLELLERERNARQEAEAANAAKDEFLAMVSHELRTPLNAILGWTRLLRSGELGVEQRSRALETVERNALAQTQLIEDLLDMTRIMSGKLTLQREPLELESLIQASIDAVRPAAETAGVRIQSRVDGSAGTIDGDPVRMQQVVLNLLTNALKFTPKGGTIMVLLEWAGDAAEVSVIDSGSGIPPSFVPHVFERFRQGEDGQTQSRPGLGLGLAIVKHIVDLHGGTVVAESEGAGRGATFRVRLPRLRRSVGFRTPLPSVRATEAFGTTRRLGGLKVLVVDDDLDSRELLATIVAQEGADVTLACSAQEAMESIQATRPDVLVSDIGMPGEDGHELMRRIRQLPPERGGRTPALALTAFAQPQDRIRALDAGFDLHVAKPADPTELAISVARLAGR